MNKVLKELRLIKLPVYWRFIITYLLIVVIVIGVLTPIYYEALSIAKQVYLKETQYSLIRSAEDFENTVEAVWRIPNTMELSPYYTKMKLFRGDKLTSEYYVYLNLARDFFTKQCHSVDLPEESFMLFTNSGAAVTRKRIYESIESCFSEQLVYDESRTDEIIERIIKKDYFKIFIPVSAISNDFAGENDRYLALFTRQSNDSIIVGTLFSEHRILELFNIPNLPEDTFFYIKDTANNMLVSCNYEYAPLAVTEDVTEITHNKSTYNILKYTMGSIGYEAIIGIPDSHFIGLLVSLRSLNSRYIVIAIIIGILLSSIFALVNYMPLKKLLDIPMIIEHSRNKPRLNEYRYLREIMERSDNEIQKLRTNIRDMDNTLRVNLFIRLLHGNVNTYDETSLVMQLIPQLASGYRIAIVKLDIFDNDTHNIDYLSFLIYDQLSHFLSSNFLFGQLDRTKTAVLLPDTQQANKLFPEVIKQINSNIKVHNIVLETGISEVFNNIDRINTAFYHAQFSLLENSLGKSEDLICYYTATSEIEPLSIDLTGLQRLYELIQAGKCKDIEDMLDEVAFVLMNGKAYSSEDVRKTFYIMRFVFESIVKNMNYRTIILPEYQENKTVKELFASLGDTANKIVMELEERKQSANSELKKELLEYINNNFSDKLIYATSIANSLGISEGYVYKLVKECTGISLNDYIRKLRAEKAAQMLKSTNLSVANISDACGFDVLKTFYRAFRKYYGITPSQYRE